MVQVVSFDYFPFTQYINFGLIETEPWSEQFAYLGYDTINFFEGMGSIMLTMWIGSLYLLFVALRHKFCKKKCRGKYKPIDAWDSTLALLTGTFFEVILCLSVSMKMFSMWEYLKAGDKFSIANQMVVCVVMVLYILLSIFFVLCRAPKLVSLNKHA